jgi:hypothetical protein
MNTTEALFNKQYLKYDAPTSRHTGFLKLSGL